MSQPAGTEPTQGQEGTTDTGTGGVPTTEVTPTEQQPLYADALNELPESVRPLVEPIFKDWDTKVSERFQKVHSEYEPWKPITSQYDPEAVSNAVALARYLEENPRELYDRIAEAYGYNTSEQGQPGQQPAQQQVQPGDEEEPPDPTAAKLSELEQALVAIATHLQTQQQSTEMDNNVKVLNQTLEGLKTTHGDYNEQYVLTMIANGADPETAVLSWKAELQKAIQNGTQPNTDAPTVISGTGAVPSTQADLGKLGDNDTQDLVVKLLQQANQT